jgi:hypothetical protein
MKKTKSSTRKRKQTGRGNVFSDPKKQEINKLREQADEIKNEMKPLFERSEGDIRREKIYAKMESGDLDAVKEHYNIPLNQLRSTSAIKDNTRLLDKKHVELKIVLDKIASIEEKMGGKRKVRRRRTKKVKKSRSKGKKIKK